VSHLRHFGMRTQSNQKGFVQQESVQSLVHGIKHFWQMVWVIYRREKGKSPNSIWYRTNYFIRYANMDYLFWSHVMCVYWMVWLLWLRLSYDIACQFGKLFFDRVKYLPAALRPASPPDVSFCVPKFHLPVHVKSCWGPFSFNF
jgi:hypothetical protein